MRYLDRRDPRGVWANRLRAKRGSSNPAVAIANKSRSLGRLLAAKEEVTLRYLGCRSPDLVEEGDDRA
jgi:hypothetical protein